MEKEIRRVIYKVQSALENFDQLEEMEEHKYFRGALSRKTKKFFEFYTHHLGTTIDDLHSGKELSKTTKIVQDSLNLLSCRGRTKECVELALMLAKLQSALNDLCAIKEGMKESLVAGPLIMRLKIILGIGIAGKFPYQYEELIPYVETYAVE